jgi:carbonic anhydrase/acetyltransferase-like protein (isoleucine patch superfamily)
LQNVIAVGGLAPQIDETAFVDPSARIMGAVTLGPNTGVWAGAIVRGDDAQVVVGDNSAILENCLVESPEGRPVVIAANCLVSHGAILHGCRLGEGALIGIGAIVLDGAVIGPSAIVGAGAVVPPGAEVPAGKLVLGTPGKAVRDLRPEEAENVQRELQRLGTKAGEYKRLFANHQK